MHIQLKVAALVRQIPDIGYGKTDGQTLTLAFQHSLTGGAVDTDLEILADGQMMGPDPIRLEGQTGIAQIGITPQGQHSAGIIIAPVAAIGEGDLTAAVQGVNAPGSAGDGMVIAVVEIVQKMYGAVFLEGDLQGLLNAQRRFHILHDQHAVVLQGVADGCIIGIVGSVALGGQPQTVTAPQLPGIGGAETVGKVRRLLVVEVLHALDGEVAHTDAVVQGDTDLDIAFFQPEHIAHFGMGVNVMDHMGSSYLGE